MHRVNPDWRRRINVSFEDLGHAVVERISFGKMPDGQGDPPAWFEYPQPFTD